MTSIGSLCSDRGAAEQAVTRGKGWDWVFGGGTARYTAPPSLNPNPPPGIDQNLYVSPVQTGNAGVVATVQRRADVAIADHECPILPNGHWSPQNGGALSFAVPEAVVSEWQDTLGIDVVYLAANHMSDRGVAGIAVDPPDPRQARAARGRASGMNLDRGPRAGLRRRGGAEGGVRRLERRRRRRPARTRTPRASPGSPRRTSTTAVRRALDGGADIVMCDPQWWGGREYHDDLLPKQVRQLSWFDKARCDHVVGAGTHVAGPMLLRQHGPDVSLVLASPGNYVFGQDFFQNLQEGVILEQQFVGPRMVNVRLHPYVIIRGARPALTDPEGDGRYILERIWRNSELRYL